MIGTIAEAILVRYSGRERLCWVCGKHIARWAVFQSHEEFIAQFDPDKSIYVAACDHCLPTAQRQDPAGHNYIRSLGTHAHMIECHNVVVEAVAT